jgi:hypothetical protein
VLAVWHAARAHLHGLDVGRDDLGERVECNVADVVVAVQQETAEDVDRQDLTAQMTSAAALRTRRTDPKAATVDGRSEAADTGKCV